MSRLFNLSVKCLCIYFISVQDKISLYIDHFSSVKMSLFICIDHYNCCKMSSLETVLLIKFMLWINHHLPSKRYRVNNHALNGKCLLLINVHCTGKCVLINVHGIGKCMMINVHYVGKCCQ